MRGKPCGGSPEEHLHAKAVGVVQRQPARWGRAGGGNTDAPLGPTSLTTAFQHTNQCTLCACVHAQSRHKQPAHVVFSNMRSTMWVM